MTKTIVEEYTLPSKGLIYSTQFDPEVKLRSMTVAEEMRRLSPGENSYKTMCEILDDCLITKLPISTYDMCFGDYQFLIHKLRIATYGPEYKINIRCGSCGTVFDHVLNLDEQRVFEYDQQAVDELKYLVLSDGTTVELGFQTPRDLDNIEKRKRTLRKQFPDMKYDPTMMLNLATVIKSIDGRLINSIADEETIKRLPLADSNLILQRSNKLNSCIGIDINVEVGCPECRKDIQTTFRYTSEFFRPTVE